ncbi:ATP-binding cassette domain-containing protein [Cronbergia sp. UHCC 0137]|uniref:ABC transporter ATP-binding protein n=1 Tax=Cronbergia sp. UHCC 0137 TaxID=3110239 RepID=UPI002B20634E|nr:ATP-binding cassette domain-containing protein [Cronbergia sp. UHCC 0137]MEA5620572.1 ATP-binding cassette domain-containing protein [Cronbergia sp. UHCC 0137]
MFPNPSSTLNNLTPRPILKIEQVNLSARLKSQHSSNLPGYSILQDISFELFAGDRLIIIGTTGAGKTSLLRLLNRLTEPTSGKIYLENQEYRQIPVIQLRQQVTLVQQESKLLGMTVQEALAYPLVLRGLSKQIIQQKISDLQEKLHIPDQWLSKTELQLSAGQRQLIAIARALITQPKVILLDEPTSALDAGTSANLIQTLIQLTQTQSTSILMVNHQLELAQAFCTRLIHLHQGQLLTNQPASEIDWENLKATLIKAQADEEWI